MNHDIMVDIETFATDNNAAIVAIGAVAFDADVPEGTNLLDDPIWAKSPDALLNGMGQGFRVNVDLGASDPDKRGNIDPSTVEWWLGQSDEARAMLVSGDRKPLGGQLALFSAWISRQGGYSKLRLWSNGPTFDETILRAAFGRYGMGFPISFRGSRCCRTMFDFAKSLGWDPKAAAMEAPDDIVKHDALSDAVFQARSLQSQIHYLRASANVAGPTLIDEALRG